MANGGGARPTRAAPCGEARQINVLEQSLLKHDDYFLGSKFSG
jgi:hypothetical protein